METVRISDVRQLWEDCMIRLIAALFVSLVLSAVTAAAQDKYPSRAVKVIVPYAPGGATDIRKLPGSLLSC